MQVAAAAGQQAIRNYAGRTSGHAMAGMAHRQCCSVVLIACWGPSLTRSIVIAARIAWPGLGRSVRRSMPKHSCRKGSCATIPAIATRRSGLAKGELDPAQNCRWHVDRLGEEGAALGPGRRRPIWAAGNATIVDAQLPSPGGAIFQSRTPRAVRVGWMRERYLGGGGAQRSQGKPWPGTILDDWYASLDLKRQDIRQIELD